MMHIDLCDYFYGSCFSRFFSLMWAWQFLQVAAIWIPQEHIYLVYYCVTSPKLFYHRASTNICWMDWEESSKPAPGLFLIPDFISGGRAYWFPHIVILATRSESSDAWNLTFLWVFLKICFWIHVKREELVVKINVSYWGAHAFLLS